MNLVSLIIEAVSGAVGGNLAGAAMKENSLGTLGNSIAGIVGGGLGGVLLQSARANIKMPISKHIISKNWTSEMRPGDRKAIGLHRRIGLRSYSQQPERSQKLLLKLSSGDEIIPGNKRKPRWNQ
jgi:uncharacterized membrane protein YeaQ/YmgE (transglycosylase-associated protein family)